MAKKVLNKTHREALINYAQKLVVDTQDSASLDICYDAAANMVSALVEKKYPKADMDVLKKYELGRSDTCIFVSSGYGGFERFKFRNDDKRIPYVANRYCNERTPHLMDENQVAIFVAWQDAENQYKASVQQRIRDFSALIEVSRTFEDVEQVWPSAGALREKICGINTSIAAINDGVIARIKEDAANSIEIGGAS